MASSQLFRSCGLVKGLERAARKKAREESVWRSASEREREGVKLHMPSGEREGKVSPGILQNVKVNLLRRGAGVEAGKNDAHTKRESERRPPPLE